MKETRIAIIGYSGSGKSTLAKKLGQRYMCEVLHLDCVHWLPGWQERDNREMDKLVSLFCDSHDNWVIDGNYSAACYEKRMEEATQIIFLDFPRRICLFRAVKRYFTYKGKTRESISNGCEEKLDREFLWWIIQEGRNKRHREHYHNVCKKYSGKMVILKNPRAVKDFLCHK